MGGVGLGEHDRRILILWPSLARSGEEEVVTLAGKAYLVTRGRHCRSAVDLGAYHDRRSGVEDGLVAITISEDVELRYLPLRVQVREPVLASDIIDIAVPYNHFSEVLTPRPMSRAA